MMVKTGKSCSYSNAARALQLYSIFKINPDSSCRSMIPHWRVTNHVTSTWRRDNPRVWTTHKSSDMNEYQRHILLSIPLCILYLLTSQQVQSFFSPSLSCPQTSRALGIQPKRSAKNMNQTLSLTAEWVNEDLRYWIVSRNKLCLFGKLWIIQHKHLLS